MTLPEPRIPLVVHALSYAVLASSFFVKYEPAPTDLLFLLLLVAVWLVGGILPPRGLPLFVVLGLGMFVFGNFLSLMLADHPIAGLRYLVITVYMLLIFVTYAGLIGRFGLRMRRTVFRAFVHAAFAAAMIGLAARFRLIPGAELFLDDHGMRVQSSFKDPNVFAPFVVVAMLIVANDYLTRQRSILNAGVYGFLFTLSILFAFSRGALLHLGVSLLVYSALTLLVIRDPRASARLLAGISAVGAAAFLVFSYMLAFTGLSDFFVERLSVQAYDTERFAMQRLSLQVASEIPYGIGPGEFIKPRFPNDPHNVYLRVLVENGHIGLVGWLTWLAACAHVAWTGVRRRGAEAQTYAVCLALIAGVGLESLFIDSLHWRHLFLVMGIPVGLAIVEAGSPDRFRRDSSLPGMAGASSTARV